MGAAVVGEVDGGRHSDSSRLAARGAAAVPERPELPELQACGRRDKQHFRFGRATDKGLFSPFPSSQTASSIALVRGCGPPKQRQRQRRKGNRWGAERSSRKSCGSSIE